MRLAFLQMILISIGLLSASPALAQPCVHPNLDNVFEQSRAAIGVDSDFYPDASMIFLTVQLGGQYFQWMGASWSAPPEGTLFVLDCKGRGLAALNLGAFEQIRAGPEISGFGKTIEVVYIPGEGTGDQEDDVSLIAFSAKSIMVLWDHEASEVVDEPSDNYTDQYTWRYSQSATVIHVTGKRMVGELADTDHGWAPHTLHDLPSETFCWKNAQRQYTSCKGE